MTWQLVLRVWQARGVAGIVQRRRWFAISALVDLAAALAGLSRFLFRAGFDNNCALRISLVLTRWALDLNWAGGQKC